MVSRETDVDQRHKTSANAADEIEVFVNWLRLHGFISLGCFCLGV